MNNSVKYVPLKELADVINGYAFKSNEYVDDGLRIIRISDVQERKISDQNLVYYPIEYSAKIGKTLLSDNDIVMALTGNVGRVAIIEEKNLPCGLNQRVACIRVNNDMIINKYLYYYFDSNTFVTRALNAGKGNGQKNLSTKWLEEYLIPVPSVEQQMNIVKILDKFVKLEAELEAELEARNKQYEFWRDKIFSFNNRNDVKWLPLGKVGIEFYRGNGIKRDEIVEKGIPCVRYGEIYTTYDVWFDKCVSSTTVDVVPNPKVFEKNDLLFAITGESVEDISKCLAYVGDGKCYAGGDMVIMKHNQNGKYLSYALSTNDAKKQKMKGRVKSKVVHSSVPAIKEIVVPICSLEEQEKIVNIMDNFYNLIKSYTNGLPAEIEARRKQYRYYRDKLLSFEEVEVNE